ncbi:MAG: hypothetical protein AAGF48_16405 [Pseudomonadota bacterium]
MTLNERTAAAGLRFLSATPVELQSRIWICVGFEEIGRTLGDHPHLAFLYGGRDWLKVRDLHGAIAEEFEGAENILTRIHSECLLGDAFGSTMCDCGDQMRLALEEMESQRSGIFLYLRQEGRGIGMRNKLDVLALQYGFCEGQRNRRRHSSDEANLAMGFAIDERRYHMAAGFLNALGVASVQLITGNPDKIGDIEKAGIRVASAIDLWTNGVSNRAADELKEKVARGYIYQR